MDTEINKSVKAHVKENRLRRNETSPRCPQVSLELHHSDGSLMIPSVMTTKFNKFSQA